MKRMTKKNGKEIYVCDEKKALERLAQFEDFFFDLIQDQKEISQQITMMQNEMRTKQYRYREISAQKVTNSLILRKLKEYGITEEAE